MAESKFENALKIINQIPEKKKIDPAIQYMQYQIFLKQNQFFMALFHLNEILKRKTFTKELTEIQIHLRIAEVYELMEKRKKALQEYYTVVGLDSENYEANKKIGMTLYSLKNFGSAIPYLEKTHLLNPKDPEICRFLGDSYYVEGSYEDAVKMLNAALTEGSQDVRIFLTRGKCNLKTGAYQECIADMELLQEDPAQLGAAKLHRGIAEYHLSRYDEAFQNLNSALSQMTDDTGETVIDARYILSSLFTEKGMLKDALRQLNIIHGVSKQYKDINITSTIALYAAILSNRTFQDAVEMNISEFIDRKLTKGLSINGHTIIKTDSPGGKQAMVITKKNTSSGQTYRCAVCVNLSVKIVSDQLIQKFLKFLEQNELTSGYFCTLYPPSDEQKQMLQTTGFEIEIPDLNEFENIVIGKKSL